MKRPRAVSFSASKKKRNPPVIKEPVDVQLNKIYGVL